MECRLRGLDVHRLLIIRDRRMVGMELPKERTPWVNSSREKRRFPFPSKPQDVLVIEQEPSGNLMRFQVRTRIPRNVIFNDPNSSDDFPEGRRGGVFFPTPVQFVPQLRGSKER